MRRTTLSLLGLSLLSAPGFAQGLVRELASPTSGLLQQFGKGLAASGDRILVGEPGQDRVYVFDARNGDITQVIHEPGEQNGALIATTGSETVIVSDSGVISVYDSQYTRTVQLPAFGSVDGDLELVPTRLGFCDPDGNYALVDSVSFLPILLSAVQPAGNVRCDLNPSWFVVGTDNHVDVFHHDGTYINTIWLPGGGSDAGGPLLHDLALDGDSLLTVNSNGDLHRHLVATGDPAGSVSLAGPGILDVEADTSVITLVDSTTVQLFASDFTPIGASPLPASAVAPKHAVFASGLVIVADPADTTFGTDAGLMSIHQPGAALGASYCGPAVPNSTGLAGECFAIGSDVAGHNSFGVEVRNLPPGQFMMLVNGPAQAFIQNPGGSQGNLCLGGGLGRHRQDIARAAFDGRVNFGFDLQVLPRPNPPSTAVQSGDTWNFQAWYRDGGVSNFTDAVSVPFN